MLVVQIDKHIDRQAKLLWPTWIIGQTERKSFKQSAARNDPPSIINVSGGNEMMKEGITPSLQKDSIDGEKNNVLSRRLSFIYLRRRIWCMSICGR